MEALTKSLLSQLEAGSKLRGYACSGDELDALLEARRVKAVDDEMAADGDAAPPPDGGSGAEAEEAAAEAADAAEGGAAANGEEGEEGEDEDAFGEDAAPLVAMKARKPTKGSGAALRGGSPPPKRGVASGSLSAAEEAEAAAVPAAPVVSVMPRRRGATDFGGGPIQAIIPG